MTVYELYCTLCDKSYSKLSKWNKHLVNSLHQNSAKKKLCDWDKSVRKCCVVIYSRVNLSKTMVNFVIPYFVENITNGASLIVTDLILSADRPGFGIIRFENREKVDQLFSMLKNSSVKIDNHLYQFRQLGKFLKLEWEELLVSSLNLELPKLTTQLKDDPLTKRKRPTKAADRDEDTDNQKDNDKVSCPVKSILKQMKVPIQESNFVENFIQEVEQILEELIPQKCFIELYRNNYLKIRNNPVDSRYLIFMYIYNDQSSGFTAIDMKTEEQIVQKISTNPESKSAFQELITVHDPSDNRKIAQRFPNNFVHQNLGIHFRLTTFPPSMASLQLSRLVKYYCKFDPRVKPLLSLVHFWAKLNGIRLSSTKVRERDTHSHEVDPVALEWLLLFFLFHKEQALPVPRQILERPHQPIWFSKTDLGFNQDLEFPRTWKTERKNGYPSLKSEESGKHLLLILKKFFEFCSKMLGTGRHIINVRDGELLSSECASEPFILYGVGKEGIKDNQFGEHLKGLEYSYISSLTSPKLDRIIIMTNPFEMKWKLTIYFYNWFHVVNPAMQRTAKQLETFLSKKGCSIADVSIESVLFCD